MQTPRAVVELRNEPLSGDVVENSHAGYLVNEIFVGESLIVFFWNCPSKF